MLSSCASENRKWEAAWTASCQNYYFPYDQVLETPSAPQCWRGSWLGYLSGGNTDSSFSLETTGQTSSVWQAVISCWWVRDETRKSPSLPTEHLRRYNLVSPVVTSPRVCWAERVCTVERRQLRLTDQLLRAGCCHFLFSHSSLTQQPLLPPTALMLILQQGSLGPLFSIYLFPFSCLFFFLPSDPGLCEVQSWVCVYVARPLLSWLNLPPFHIPSWILPMAPKSHLWFPFGQGQQAQCRQGQSHPEELHLYSSLFCTSPWWIKAHDS